jgi:hypothetical protein
MSRGTRLSIQLLFCVSLLFASSALPSHAQTSVPEPDATAARTPKRIHLILKDGSYQIVTSYTVSGKIVRYTSAERGGTQEEIPLELVDLDATHRWEQQHSTPAEGAPPPALDPELLKEEEERAALTPSVEPDLLLPQEDSFLALDFYHGTPELVPLVQSDGDLNHTTSHSIVKKIVNPRSASHQLVTLRGVKSFIQLHVDTPEFYLRVDDDSSVPTGGSPLVVDTHGASSAGINNQTASKDSRYVIVRADVRTDARVIASFSTSLLGTTRQNEDIVETKSETLRGGHWIKLTPARPLEIGEYAIIEVLSDKEFNLGVWDFGIHPTAPDNRDALKPEPKRRPNLERRKPDQ